MKLTFLAKVFPENLNNPPSWVKNLLIPLNQFNEQVYNALSHNLTIGDNVVGDFYTISFTTPSTYGAGSPPGFTNIKFIWNYSNIKAPEAVLIAQISPKSANTYITDAVGVPTWSYDSGTITVSYITGLAASTTYNVRFMIF